VSEY